ncbi:MAG: transposase [Desulfobacteraceae bacterium]|jgi:putative transposase
MKKRKTYSGTFKAKVVTEFIHGKMELEDLAEKYQVHPNQIKNWKSLLFKRAHIIFSDRRQSKNNSAEY